MAVLCPLDQKDDSVQKLSALFTAGQSIGTYQGTSYGTAYVNGKPTTVTSSSSGNTYSTTSLAASVAPPTPPVAVTLLQLMGWSLLFYLSACLIIAPYFVWKRLKVWVSSDTSIQKQIFTPLFSFYCVIALLFGWALFWAVLLIPLLNRIRMHEDLARRIELYQESVHKWDQLFYCHRCDIIFDPVSGNHFRRNQLYTYLNIDAYKR